jgi:hypothetical protein
MKAGKTMRKILGQMLQEYSAREIKVLARFMTSTRGMPPFLPLDRYISTYFTLKDRTDFDRLNSALAALECFAWGYIMPEFTWGDFYLGGHHTPLDNAELYELERRLVFAGSLLHGSFHVIMSDVPDGSAMLQRAALESAVQGMFFEHISNLEYRKRFEQNQELYNNRDVAWTAVRFYRRINEESERLQVPLEEVFSQPNHRLRNLSNISISFRHIIRVLTDWNVFNAASNEPQNIDEIYSALSEVIHSQIGAGFLDVEEAIRKMRETTDYILVGTLRTMKNLRPNMVNDIRDSFEWNVFLRYVMKGQLDSTKLCINQEMKALLQKKSFEWFEQAIRTGDSLDYKVLTKEEIANLYSKYLKSKKKTFEEWLLRAKLD